MSKIIIPLNAFKAVQKAQSKDQTRYYLGGVYVEDETLVATDGSMLLRYTLGDDATGIAEPVILYVDPNEKAMKPKDGANVYMHVDLERNIVETYYRNPETFETGKRLGVCACEVIDGTFPSYERIIPKRKSTDTDGIGSFSFNPAFIAVCAAAGKVFGVKNGIRIVTGDSVASPANVYFTADRNLEGVIMPIKFTD